MVEIILTIINSMVILISDYKNKYYIKIERILTIVLQLKLHFQLYYGLWLKLYLQL